MEKMINIGRLVQGVHIAMGSVGNPDEKIAAILGLSVREFWQNVTGDGELSSGQIGTVARHFDLPVDSLLRMGEGLPAERPRSSATPPNIRVSPGGRITERLAFYSAGNARGIP